MKPGSTLQEDDDHKHTGESQLFSVKKQAAKWNSHLNLNTIEIMGKK